MSAAHVDHRLLIEDSGVFPARGLGNLYGHSSALTMEQAGDAHVNWTPRCWMRRDPLLGFERRQGSAIELAAEDLCVVVLQCSLVATREHLWL